MDFQSASDGPHVLDERCDRDEHPHSRGFLRRPGARLRRRQNHLIGPRRFADGSVPAPAATGRRPKRIGGSSKTLILRYPPRRGRFSREAIRSLE